MGKLILLTWLLLLPIWTLARLPVWQSDRTLWTAQADHQPTARAWANLERWDRVIEIVTAPALRQPFARRARPRVSVDVSRRTRSDEP